jgi:hypothetical protein
MGGLPFLEFNSAVNVWELGSFGIGMGDGGGSDLGGVEPPPEGVDFLSSRCEWSAAAEEWAGFGHAENIDDPIFEPRGWSRIWLGRGLGKIDDAARLVGWRKRVMRCSC